MIEAWHFVGEKLRNGDPVPEDGEWLEWNRVKTDYETLIGSPHMPCRVAK